MTDIFIKNGFVLTMTGEGVGMIEDGAVAIVGNEIVAVGKNYADHAAEMGGDVPDSPVLFLKPPTSVIGPLQPIRLPQQAEEVHHEAELAVVIG